MIDFLCKSFSDPSIFWPMVESIATVIAAIFAGIILFRELPKYGKEVTKRRIEGLRYVEEQFRTKGYISSSNTLFKVTHPSWEPDEKARGEVSASLRLILSTYEYVAKLIKLEYIDLELLNFVFGDDTAGIHYCIQKLISFDIYEGYVVPLLDEFAEGYELITTAGEEIEWKRMSAEGNYEMSKLYEEMYKEND